MRRKFQFVWAVTATMACLAYSQPDSTEQLRQAVSELLEGRIAILRVYPDSANDPRGFEKVRAPIANLAVGSAAIKAVYPAVSDRAFVVLMATDQTDEAVATALGSRVEKESFSDKLTLSLHLDPIDPNWNPMWTFFDARGEPMPGAAIEIWTYTPDPQVNILLARTTLDERSQLPRLSPSGRFFFHVSHPNYGMGRVQLRQAKEDPSGVWLVPLVPADSEAASSSIQGTVVDNEGRPVADAMVWCTQVLNPDGSPMEPGPEFLFAAVTDDQGWFSLCVPAVGADLVLKELPVPGSRYEIQIEPPKALSLRRSGIREPAIVRAGTRNTLTLTPMEVGKTFHTFAFEYYDGPVTDPEELGRIEMRLYRDGQEWVCLTYDQLKGGYALPPGTLRTMTRRWGQPFHFTNVELMPDSPEHIVVRGAEPTFYRGRVVDGVTGEPIRGAIVSTCGVLDADESGEVTAERWQHLQTLLLRAAASDSPDALYQIRDRVTATDAEGVFEVPFLSGLHPYINTFVVDMPGYEQVTLAAHASQATGQVDIETVGLKPLGSPEYFPIFIIEDETGSPIDPDEFSEGTITIQDPDGRVSQTSLVRFLEKRQFRPGLYNLHAVRAGTRYLYMPVDLSLARPETVVFTPRLVQQTGLVCQGQVIHGITGKPIPHAFVVHCPMAVRYDASGLERGQWAVLESLGPDPDPNDPVLAPLLKRFDLPGPMMDACTVTDPAGWYRIAIQQSRLSPADTLLAVAQDFLGARQMLVQPSDTSGGLRYEPLVPDEDGVVRFEPMKLFPAGTIVLHPVCQDPGLDKSKSRLRLRWIVAEEDRASWVEDLWITPRDNHGASAFYQAELLPNVSQTVYVPAGLDLKLIVHQIPRSPFPPIQLGNLRLAQGEVVKLGRVEFPPGVEVLLKVVDHQDHPLGGVQVTCLDEDRTTWDAWQQTNEAGMVTIRVNAHSTGQFLVRAYNRQTRERLEEGTPYQVGGDEDAGRQFTLIVSREMAAALAEQAWR